MCKALVNKGLITLSAHGPILPLSWAFPLANPVLFLSRPMKHIEFVFFDAGGGHRSAATALRLAIESRQPDWDVQLMNLQQELDKLDVLRRLTGIRIQDFYNSMLRTGWTLGSSKILLLLQATIRVYHGALVKLLTKYWRSVSPDMVVSFVPHFNRVLGESFQIAFPG